MESRKNEKTSSLRWKILRNALLRHPSPPNPDEESQMGIKHISRRTTHGFNLIPFHIVDDECDSNKSDGSSTDVRVCYTLPIPGAPQLFLTKIFYVSSITSDKEWTTMLTSVILRYVSDTTLTTLDLSVIGRQKMFLLTIAHHIQTYSAVTEASEVVISDGNPQVVNYTQRNIEANYGAFGGTIVKSMMLHWNQEDTFNVADTFDIIVASDCTFFKDFHRGLAHAVKQLLSKAGSSEAIFLSPKRGNSLDLFLEMVEENGLNVSVTESYDTEVWKRHEGFLNGEDTDSWPSYEKGHCYPLLIRITL